MFISRFDVLDPETYLWFHRKAGAGSFVRASKIGASRDFAQALTERYTADAGQAFADETLLRELQNEMNAPYLELVGLDKISRKQRYSNMELNSLPPVFPAFRNKVFLNQFTTSFG